MKNNKIKGEPELETVVVTSGSAYIDIDVLACSLALSHLYNLLGRNSIVCHTGKQNGTIPKSLKNLTKSLYSSQLNYSTDYSYALVDVSNPEFFEDFVQIERIIEVYDHHFGFEKYWQENLGKSSNIQHVGACATLIWEKYIENNQAENIQPLIAELLYLAIISNTLNLKAFVTTDQDKLAKLQLENTGLIPKQIILEYYAHIESQMLDDFKSSLIHDVKKHYWSEKICLIGQLELLDSDKLIEEYFLNDKAEKYLRSHFAINDELWFVIISDINKELNFIYTKSEPTKRLIERTFSFFFKGDFATSDRLWMRKELIRDMV